MSDQDSQRLIRVLEEIRDNQKLLPDRQAEGLALQREQCALVQKQHERVERVQDRAEQIQTTSAQLVAGSRKLLVVHVPIIIALIAYVTWLLFREASPTRPSRRACAKAIHAGEGQSIMGCGGRDERHAKVRHPA